MASLISDDDYDFQPHPEPPKKNPILSLVILCVFVGAVIGVSIAITNAGFLSENYNKDVTEDIYTYETQPQEQVSDNTESVAQEEKDTEYSIPIVGESFEVTKNGIHVLETPKDLVLTTGQPFGINLVIEVQDDIDPNITEIHVSSLTRSIVDSADLVGDEYFKFDKDWMATSDAIEVDEDFEEYEITNFKPGDVISFTVFGTCPDNADLHEGEAVSGEIYGYYAPDVNQYGVSMYGDKHPLADFDYEITIQNDAGETSGDALRYGEAAEKGIEVEEYDAETRQELNEALERARQFSQDPEERYEIFRKAIDDMNLTISLEGMQDGVLKVRTFNGYIIMVNFNPDHDGEPMFDY